MRGDERLGGAAHGVLAGQGKIGGSRGRRPQYAAGLLRAQGKRHKQFGILHIDAHLDLRIAYEGFTYSHASIMYNALPIKQLTKLVSVGIRDFCEQENEVFLKNKERVRIVRSADVRRQQYEGITWREQCDAIIAGLPDKVHISFDIDGLDPTLCPNTGTPVPGGFQYEEATYLLSRLVHSGRTVIGFDLVEVSPGKDEWDANVGARLLYHLCGVLAAKKR
jgi:agmatinase